MPFLNNIAALLTFQRIRKTFINSIEVYKKHRTLFLLISLVYLCSILVGYLTHGFEPARSYVEAQEAAQEAMLNQNPLLNWLKEHIQKGGWNIITGGLVIFLVNTFGVFVEYTLLGLLIVLPPIRIAHTGWYQGVVTAIEGKAPPLGMGYAYLEFFTYFLAAVAGTNIGLSMLFPKRYDTDSRWTSFKRAWKEAGYIYLWIAIISLIVGIWEAFYPPILFD